MKPSNFGYARPDDMGELVDLLAAEGEDARILAGGQSLGPILNMRLVRPKLIVDINRISGLAGITEGSDSIRIGATTRQAEALASAVVRREVPLLPRLLRHVGHYQTRSRGTIGGSIAHGDPSAELPLGLVTLEGEVELASRKGKRRVPASEFFLSPLLTAREANEVLVAVHWPRRAPLESYAFREFCLRSGDFAIAAVACRAVLDRGEIRGLRIGLGCVGEVPVAFDFPDAVGHRLVPSLVESVIERIRNGVTPVEDLHATSAYRRQITAVLVEEVLQDAFAQTEESGE